jgi:hypothetical protein
MSFRSFVLIFFIILIAFIAGNLILWHCETEKLFSCKFDGGDLARMGFISGVKHLRTTEFSLPRRHLEMHDFRGQSIDVLTIGDSFSFGSGRGLNPFYQDYIATVNNITVMNVYPYPTDDLFVGFSPLSTLMVLYNSGYLDIIKPKIIIIESVERYCLVRYAKPVNSQRKDSLDKVIAFYKKSRELNLFKSPDVGFINNGNLMFLLANLAFKVKDNYKHKVYKFKTKINHFSGKNGNTLVVLGEDIRNSSFSNKKTVASLNDNFNKVSDMLAAKGIKLYFMPVVDKYNLYGDFIIGNTYPKSCFFEELRPLPKKYTLIDTKEILLDSVRKGEKDVYYQDDTHWSWKASEKIFSTFRFN